MYENYGTSLLSYEDLNLVNDRENGVTWVNTNNNHMFALYLMVSWERSVDNEEYWVYESKTKMFLSDKLFPNY